MPRSVAAEQAALAIQRGRDPWRAAILLAAGLVALHTASRQSIVYDEAVHAAAGLAYWQHGRFDIYPHNPPLVKLWAALPLWCSGARIHSEWLGNYGPVRGEAFVGQTLIEGYGARAEALFMRARLAIVALYLLCAWMVGDWAGKLFGRAAGRAAMLLWCFHPLALAHGTLATVDMGAAVAGLAASRAFVRWLETHGWLASVWAGCLCGAALASKFTMLVLGGVFLVLAVLAQLGERCRWQEYLRRMAQASLVCAAAVAVVGATYGFQGLGRGLGEHAFESSAFRRAQQLAHLAVVRLPLNALAGMFPEQYLRGLDLQWLDVEVGFPQAFLGQLRREGFWYYYPVALALKVPALFWLALLWAGARLYWRPPAARGQVECLVLAPLALYATCQCHPSVAFLRYLLPTMPFLCVLASSIAEVVPGQGAAARWGARLLISGAALVPLVQHPHYIGYVNVWAGGPQRGWRWFSFGDMDWGQDIGGLRRWQERHPEARPMRLAIYTIYQPPRSELADDTPLGPDRMPGPASLPVDRVPTEPHVGYLAVSATILNMVAAEGDSMVCNTRMRDFCRWVRAREPVAMVGTSILIYRFSVEDVRQWHAARGGERGHG